MATLTLHIRPEGAHQYLARVFDGKVLVGLPTIHAGLASAIEAYGQAEGFPGVTAFDVWYAGASVGAIPPAQMRSDATKLANRLVVLSAVLR